MGADRPFPGFDAIFIMADPVDDGAWFGTIDLPDEILARLFLGEEQHTAPIVVRHFMGGDAPTDVVWTEGESAVIVNQRVVDVLTAEGFTGWATWPASLLMADGSTLVGYHGLAITGRCGRIDYALAELIDPSGPLPLYGPPFFDPASWDGSDLFASDLHGPFVVPAVKTAMERAGVGNVSFLPLTEVLAPRVIGVDLAR
jgi:hypothetical protein